MNAFDRPHWWQFIKRYKWRQIVKHEQAEFDESAAFVPGDQD